jgi:hypothetical protein
MTDKTRIKIAAAVTALFLAGISAVGLAARDDQPQAAARPTAQPAPATQTPTATPAGTGLAYEDERDDDERAEEHDDDE